MNQLQGICRKVVTPTSKMLSLVSMIVHYFEHSSINNARKVCPHRRQNHKHSTPLTYNSLYNHHSYQTIHSKKIRTILPSPLQQEIGELFRLCLQQEIGELFRPCLPSPLRCDSDIIPIRYFLYAQVPTKTHNRHTHSEKERVGGRDRRQFIKYNKLPKQRQEFFFFFFFFSFPLTKQLTMILRLYTTQQDGSRVKVSPPHVIKVREDEGLVHIEPARNDVLSILNCQPVCLLHCEVLP